MAGADRAPQRVFAYGGVERGIRNTGHNRILGCLGGLSWDMGYFGIVAFNLLSFLLLLLLLSLDRV